MIMWLADARAFTHPTSKAREKCPGDKVTASPLPMCQIPVFPLVPHMIFVLFLSAVLDLICIFPPPVPHPYLPSHLTCILCLLLLPSIVTLPPVSPLPLCHCLPCPLFCVCYFYYSNHLLHSLCFLFTLSPSVQAFSPFFPLFPSQLSLAMFFRLVKTPGPSCSKQG